MTPALKTVPIPPKMRMLDRDRRGYPIPWIVTRDLTGRAFFVMNDVEKTLACGRRKLCGICGRKLERDVWLIGGPGAAFHANGAYLDPPMHHQCASYAVRVCPYLGSRYTGRVDQALLKHGKFDPRQRVLTEEHMLPEQPPFFVLSRTVRAPLHWKVAAGETPRFHPQRPWLEIEFWKHGQQISEIEATALLDGSQTWPWTTGDLIHWPKPDTSDIPEAGPDWFAKAQRKPARAR